MRQSSEAEGTFLGKLEVDLVDEQYTGPDGNCTVQHVGCRPQPVHANRQDLRETCATCQLELLYPAGCEW